MGRGISPLQRDLLGLAYAVNTYTLGGKPAVKTGAPVDGYRGPADLNTALGIYAVKRIAPSTEVQSGTFHGTPKCKSAKAAVSRAISRLIERDLLALQPKGGELYCYGYVLTTAGFEIAKGIECNPPGLAEAVELFGIRAGAAYREYKEAKRKSNPGFPIHYADWISGQWTEGSSRSDQIRRLQDALMVIDFPAVGRG